MTDWWLPNKINTNSAFNDRPFHVHDEQAAKRQRILDAARSNCSSVTTLLSSHDGPCRRRAGVAKGTLYLYFPSGHHMASW